MGLLALHCAAPNILGGRHGSLHRSHIIARRSRLIFNTTTLYEPAVLFYCQHKPKFPLRTYIKSWHGLPPL